MKNSIIKFKKLAAVLIASFMLLQVMACCSKQNTNSELDTSTSPFIGIDIDERTVSRSGLSYDVFCILPFIGWSYGDDYTIEELKGDKWTPLNTIVSPDSIFWASVSYTPSLLRLNTQKIDWTWLYGELNAGTYRIKKIIQKEWNGRIIHKYIISEKFRVY